MPKFFYKLVSTKNEIVEGEIQAISKSRAIKDLTEDGSTMLLIRRDPNSLLYRRLNLPAFGFSPLERILFFRNLALMIDAGVSVVNALHVLQNQIKSSGVRRAVGEMAGEVEQGQKFSAAMKKHPKYFAAYLSELVAVGEHSGELTEILRRISLNLQRNYELRRKIVSSITYPVIIIIVMIAVVTGLITFVLPKIADLYHELDAPLPVISSGLLTFGNFVRSQPFVILAIVVGLIALGLLMRANNKGRKILHRIIFRIPIFGELIKEYNLARLFRGLKMLLASGLSLVESVKIARKTLKNEVYLQALGEIYPVLLHGTTLTETLEHYPNLFPGEAQRIVEVGEQTGNVENSFEHIMKHYEEMVDHKTQVMASIIEPVLMVAIGLVVGGIALSIFLPIYQVSSII